MCPQQRFPMHNLLLRVVLMCAASVSCTHTRRDVPAKAARAGRVWSHAAACHQSCGPQPPPPPGVMLLLLQVEAAAVAPGAVLQRVPHRPHPGLLQDLGDPRRLRHRCAALRPAPQAWQLVNACRRPRMLQRAARRSSSHHAGAVWHTHAASLVSLLCGVCCHA